MSSGNIVNLLTEEFCVVYGGVCLLCITHCIIIVYGKKVEYLLQSCKLCEYNSK